MLSHPVFGSWGVYIWGTLGYCSGLGRKEFRLGHQIPKAGPLHSCLGRDQAVGQASPAGVGSN